MTNPKDPSQPTIVGANQEFKPQVGESQWQSPGLTKREHFASLIMQGICSLESWHMAGPNSIRQKAELSVAHADALIEALNK